MVVVALNSNHWVLSDYYFYAATHSDSDDHDDHTCNDRQLDHPTQREKGSDDQ